MVSENVIKLLEMHGDEILGKIIADAIRDHSDKAAELHKNWMRYLGEAPIKKRASVDKAKISVNEKLANDYPGDIVDQLKGFVFGEDIGITYADKNPAVEELLNNFAIENNIAKKNTHLAEYMLSCGYGARLLNEGKEDGELRVKDIRPWEVVFIFDSSYTKVDYALVYYEYEYVNETSGKTVKSIRAEWYDKENVHYFIKDGSKFVRETGQVYEDGELKEIINPMPHLFDGVPVIKFTANSREQAAFHKVISLIDGYDIALSDWLNEVVEFRNAYLKAVGAVIDEEERKKARRTGVLNMPDKDTDVDFITKDLNPEFVDRLVKILDNNIYKYSKTVNMSDEKFTSGGAESGEGRKWKMVSMFFEGIVIERYFTASLREMYRLLASNWNAGNEKLDYRKIEFEFTRKLPNDLLYAMEILEKGWGRLPKKTIYKLLPFIDNVDEALEMFKKEQEEEGVDLDNIAAE